MLIIKSPFLRCLYFLDLEPPNILHHLKQEVLEADTDLLPSQGEMREWCKTIKKYDRVLMILSLMQMREVSI